jgi:glycerol-3-phosphate acyltransferase PlsY
MDMIEHRKNFVRKRKEERVYMKETIIAYGVSILIGYLLGTLSPAALISKLKNKNIRKSGTGNLGASNVMLHFGKVFGILVMAFDIGKSFAAARLAQMLFSTSLYVGMIAGIAAILGHIFPFYMHFKGGKGLAAFGGLIMAYEPWLLAVVLAVGSILMLIVNYSFIMPYFASAVFVGYVAYTSQSLPMILLALAPAILIMYMHFENVIKAFRGTDVKIRKVAVTNKNIDDKE